MDRALAEKLLDEKLPEDEVIFLGEGWSSEAFEIGPYVCRVSKQSVDAYVKEKFVLDKLPSFIKKIAFPKLEIFSGEKMSYSFHKKINGNFLSFKKCVELDVEKQDLLCSSIVDFLVEMHSIPLSAFENEKINLYGENLISYDFLKAALKEEFDEEEIKLLYDSLKKDFYYGEKVFLHNDFSFANIMFDENCKLSCVFDFANSSFGSRIYEFLNFFPDESNDIFNRVLSSYCERTGVKIDIEDIKFLKYRNYIYALSYLFENNLKDEMIGEWKDRVSKVRFFLNNYLL